MALHIATDSHHGGALSGHGDALTIEMALHGHAHAEGTPAHWHPFVGSVVAPVPGKLLLLIGAMMGGAPEAVFTETSGRCLLSKAGPSHDPPPRLQAVSILRI